MDNTSWLKQIADKPLFPDMLWSRPVNKRHAGKLLIVGGNSHGFTAPAGAFAQAEKAGIGTVRVLLPDSLYKTLGKSFQAGEFASSTPSGSFAKSALIELLDMSHWADGVLLAGDFGHNSETAVLLESYISKYTGQLTLVGDTMEYCLNAPEGCLNREDTTVVLNTAGLQKLAVAAKFTSAFTSNMALMQLIDKLASFASDKKANLVIIADYTCIVLASGRLSTTKLPEMPSPEEVATKVAVWTLQNPTKQFEAITTALLN